MWLCLFCLERLCLWRLHTWRTVYSIGEGVPAILFSIPLWKFLWPAEVQNATCLCCDTFYWWEREVEEACWERKSLFRGYKYIHASLIQFSLTFRLWPDTFSTVLLYSQRRLLTAVTGRLLYVSISADERNEGCLDIFRGLSPRCSLAEKSWAQALPQERNAEACWRGWGMLWGYSVSEADFYHVLRETQWLYLLLSNVKYNANVWSWRESIENEGDYRREAMTEKPESAWEREKLPWRNIHENIRKYSKRRNEEKLFYFRRESVSKPERKLICENESENEIMKMWKWNQ